MAYIAKIMLSDQNHGGRQDIKGNMENTDLRGMSRLIVIMNPSLVYINQPSKNASYQYYYHFPGLISFFFFPVNGLDLFFVCFIFVGVQLIYNIVLASGLQQSESVTHIHICTFFFLDSFPIQAIRVLSRVPSAIQQVLISYLFYIQQCVCVNPNLPIYPSPTHIPW